MNTYLLYLWLQRFEELCVLRSRLDDSFRDVRFLLFVGYFLNKVLLVRQKIRRIVKVCCLDVISV